MNVSTDLKNMIHPKVYEELIQLSSELNMSPEVALFYIFNRMYMHRLGIDIPKDAPNNGIFWKHDEDVYVFAAAPVREAPVTSKTEPKTEPKTVNKPKTTAPAPEEATSTEDSWYSAFPKRAQNAIVAAGIQSLEDLLDNYGVEDFASLNGAGNSTAVKLQEYLKSQGHKMQTKSQFKSDKPVVSETASANLAAKAASTKIKIDSKIDTKPSVAVVDEEDDIVEDHHANMAALKFDDPTDNSWMSQALNIYARAWGVDEASSRGTLKNIFVAAGISSKDFASWSKAKGVLLDSLPVDDGQLDLIEKYAKENGIDDIEAYVLAEMNVEGGPEALNAGEASDLMAMLNSITKKSGRTTTTSDFDDEWV